MSTVQYGHIEIGANGTPMIAGTRTKVLDAEEIRRQHPHLTLGQIHAALAWYYDHQESMDQEIHAQLDEVDRLKQEAGETPVHRKLKSLGKLA